MEPEDRGLSRPRGGIIGAAVVGVYWLILLALFQFPQPDAGIEIIVFGLIVLPICILVGYLGAVLAWRTLRKGGAPSDSKIPPARLG